jgi:hypothetical protein
MVWAQWLMSAILISWEAEIRRITVRGQPRQKVLKTPHLKQWLDAVVCTCNSRYMGKHKWEDQVRLYLKINQSY